MDINEELENKEVERIKEEIIDVVEPEGAEDKKKPSKKVRSQKQIEAFEKARIKRAENIALKKQQKETLKKEKKEAKKTKIVETPNSVIDSIPPELKEEFRRSATTARPAQQRPEPQYIPQHQPQPIINNYYYGTNDYASLKNTQVPEHSLKKKRVTIITPPVSEEEEEDIYTTTDEEEETYTEEEVYSQELYPSNPTLKYKFV